MSWLIVAVVALLAVYVLLHLASPNKNRIPNLDKIVKLTPEGEVVVLDAFALDWFVGDAKTKPIVERAARRYEIIEQAQLDVVKLLATMRQRTPELSPYGKLNEIEGAVANGSYTNAARLFADFQAELSYATADTVGQSVLTDLSAKLDQLSTLKRRQNDEVMAMRPPQTSTLFWTDPVYSLVEVLFFALFGVLTNLLLQTAEHLRDRSYVQSERWVGYTKLTYGPIFAVIVVLAIMNGWIDPGYETRVWTLPLVGFVLGYASRRTAMLIDRLSEAFLGKAMDSVDQGPTMAAHGRLERANALLEASRPRSLVELKAQGQQLAVELIQGHVAHQESKA